MLKLPEKHSNKWAYIAAALFLMTFISLILVGKILKISIGTENISGFALLSSLFTVGTGIILGLFIQGIRFLVLKSSRRTKV